MINPVYIIIGIIILGMLMLISGIFIKKVTNDENKIGLALIFMGMVMLPGIPPL